MVDYKYKDLYNKSHIDKQMKIIVCDYVGYGTPDSKYPAKLEYEGKVYLDAGTNYYYKCRKEGLSHSWKKVEHEYELIVFKNSDIDWENFELSESLCSESELRFGCCEASILKFRIHNTFVPLKEKWMTVTEVLDGNTDVPFQFGRYKVFSDVPTADRLYRDVTAYDVMYDIINSSAISWYNTILPNENAKVTMKQFRTSFVNYFGLEQEEITLVNDDMIVEKTIQVEEGVEIENETEQVSILKESALSGKDVITAICEINGCFGNIGRNGKFHYVYLNQDIMGLYPSNTLFPDHAPWYLKQSETGHLYPQDPKSTSLGTGKYKSCQYEDFICKRIAKLQIRQEENDIGKIWPEGEKRPDDNCYIIENNFLVYGKPSDELKVVAKNIFDKISDVVYRPFFADCVGNPCLEVGDPVRLPTKYELVESYILTRNLKGIQSLTDGYGASGSEKYSEKMNGIHNSILQLKSKANILKRTIEETRSELIDSDQGLNSLILQTAREIRAEVKNTKEGLESSIIQKAEEITSTVSAATSKFDTKNYEVDLFGYEDGEEIKYEASENNGKYYLNQVNGNLYLSNGKSWELVEQLELITKKLSSEIKQTAESITSTVARTEKIWSEKEEDGTPINIGKYGFGVPPRIMTAEEYSPGLKYLDQTSGKVYVAVRHHPLDRPQWAEWEEYRQLEQVSTTLSTEIEQTAEGIRQEVKDTESGLSSRIAQTIDSIDLSVQNGDKQAGIKITLKKEGDKNSIEKEMIGKIDMSGLVSFTNLSANDGETIINGGNITTGEIDAEKVIVKNLNADNITSGTINTELLNLLDKLVMKIPGKSGSKRTVLRVAWPEGQTDPHIILGDSQEKYITCKSLFFCEDDFYVEKDFYCWGSGVFSKDLRVGRSLFLDREKTDGTLDNCYINTYWKDKNVHNILMMEEDGLTTNIGWSGVGTVDSPTVLRLRGQTVTAPYNGGVTIQSDERLKNSFKPLDEFDEVYMDIEPCAFKYNNGTSGRHHFGTKAQSVKEAFEKHGYTTKDFGGFVQMSDDPENEDYCGVNNPMGLIYTEFVMWNTHMIQKLYKKIEEKQREIDSLKESVSFLMGRVEDYE